MVSGGRNVARDENASRLGTRFRLWLGGGVENLLTPPMCPNRHVGGVLVDGMQPETKTRPQMGHVFVSGWKVGWGWEITT